MRRKYARAESLGLYLLGLGLGCTLGAAMCAVDDERRRAEVERVLRAVFSPKSEPAATEDGS